MIAGKTLTVDRRLIRVSSMAPAPRKRDWVLIGVAVFGFAAYMFLAVMALLMLRCIWLLI